MSYLLPVLIFAIGCWLSYASYHTYLNPHPRLARSSSETMQAQDTIVKSPISIDPPAPSHVPESRESVPDEIPSFSIPKHDWDSKDVVGYWNSPRHSYLYKSDGTWTMLPEEPGVTSGKWKILGDILYIGNKNFDTFKVIKLTSHEIIYRGTSGSLEGQTFRMERIEREFKIIPPKVITDEQVATQSPISQPTKIGRFPETQHRQLTDADLEQMSSEDLRYAINELYARHGAWFNNAEVRKKFVESSWYEPKKDLSFGDIEKAFSPIEVFNLHALSDKRRQNDQLKTDVQTSNTPEKRKIEIKPPPAKKSRETLPRDADFDDLDRY